MNPLPAIQVKSPTSNTLHTHCRKLPRILLANQYFRKQTSAKNISSSITSVQRIMDIVLALFA